MKTANAAVQARAATTSMDWLPRPRVMPREVRAPATAPPRLQKPWKEETMGLR